MSLRWSPTVFHQGLLSPLGMEAESEERPQLLVCHRAGDEARRLATEERRESQDLTLTCHPCWLPCFSGRLGQQVPRESLLELWAGITDGRGRRLGETVCRIYWRWGQRRGGGQKQEVFDRDGVGLEDWIRRSVRSGRDLS